MDYDFEYLPQTTFSMDKQHFIVCNLVGDEQEFMAHSMLRVPDELAFKLQVSEFQGNLSPIKPGS